MASGDPDDGVVALSPRPHGRTSLRIDGAWHATPADNTLRRTFMAVDFDDHAWAPAVVPGHWSESPELIHEDGPVLYRVRFGLDDRDQGEDRRRWWLAFDGIHETADVWFDGDYLGATNSWFTSTEFDVTAQIEASTEHAVALEVQSARAGGEGPANNLLGIFNDPAVVGATWNAGGVWRPVRLEESGPVRLAGIKSICTAADASTATLHFSGRLDSEALREVQIATIVTPPADGATPQRSTTTHHAASGQTTVHWEVEVPNPQLWWPHALGDQPLYDVDVELTVDGIVSDTRRVRVGLRSIELDRYHLRVNGERLFCKGATLWPTSRTLGSVSRADVDRDLRAAEDLGLDLLRVHAHIGHPELYRLADERGMLLWQDLPLRGRVHRSVEPRAAGAIEPLVERLGHHPSVVVWCAHDDPTESARTTRSSSALRQARRYLLQEAPTWSKNVLDRTLARALTRADGSRPALAHSGVLPGPTHPTGSDSQLWFGWGSGSGREFTDFADRFPNRIRWVSAFGAQAVPKNNEFCSPQRWPDLNWGNLEGEWGLDRSTMTAYVPPAEHPSFDLWAAATQAYQATILRRQIEELRRRKYAPTGGFTFASLIDVRPGISLSVIDHDREPKDAYGAVRDACRPVIVVADRMQTRLVPGELLALGVDVINDLREPVERHAVTAELSWSGGTADWRFAAEVATDSVRRVGTIHWTIPSRRGAVRLAISITDEAGAVVATNTYTAAIT